MDKEGEMTSSIRSLDSSMQTLVYENYNKFIGATDTIRKVLFSLAVFGSTNFQSTGITKLYIANRK